MNREKSNETAKDKIRPLDCTVMRSGGSQVLRNGPQDVWCVCVTMAHGSSVYVCVNGSFFISEA